MEQKKSILLPEARYDFTPLTFPEINTAYASNKTITGEVTEICNDNTLKVNLGNEIYGILPFDETTIYPLTYSKSNHYKLPKQVHSLVWEKVRVKITHIDGDNIYLSRKANMQEAYKYLKTCSHVLFYINGMSSTRAFGDIGDGIVAALDIKEVCRTRIRNISEFFHVGNTIWTKIISEDDSSRFFVSYKEAIQPYNPDNYKLFDTCRVKIGEPVDDVHSGYFVHVTPTVSGILDTSVYTPYLCYGDIVECYIIRANEKGLKLRFKGWPKAE